MNEIEKMKSVKQFGSTLIHKINYGSKSKMLSQIFFNFTQSDEIGLRENRLGDDNLFYTTPLFFTPTLRLPVIAANLSKTIKEDFKLLIQNKFLTTEDQKI